MANYQLPPLKNAEDRRGTSVPAAVADVIRAEIAGGSLIVGEKLPAEARLMEHFAISRPTCREALRILQSEGLLMLSRGNGGGARVAIPDHRRIARYASLPLRVRNATIEDTLETRILIEAAVVRRHAQTPNPTFLDELTEVALAQGRCSGSREAVVEHELRFRHLLFEGCQNELMRFLGLMLEELIVEQLQFLARRIPVQKRDLSDEGYMVSKKLEMLAFIAAGAAEEAATLWEQYLNSYIRVALERGASLNE